jgi:hypothetical protein
MSALAHPRLRRTLRSPAPILVVAIALSWVNAGMGPEARHPASSYAAASHSDTGLPATALSKRGLEVQTADRVRDQGPTGVRRSHRGADQLTGYAGGRACDAPHREPEGAARRALQRAGRLAAPTTAPPILS